VLLHLPGASGTIAVTFFRRGSYTGATAFCASGLAIGDPLARLRNFDPRLTLLRCGHWLGLGWPWICRPRISATMNVPAFNPSHQVDNRGWEVSKRTAIAGHRICRCYNAESIKVDYSNTSVLLLANVGPGDNNKNLEISQSHNKRPSNMPRKYLVTHLVRKHGTRLP